MRRVKTDAGWILSQIKASQYGSLREIATRVKNNQGRPIGPGPLSRAINGERELHLPEIRELADLLGVPMGEMIRRLGIPFGKRDGV